MESKLPGAFERQMCYTVIGTVKVQSKQIREGEEAMQQVFHEIAPIYDKDSRVLILGSFPSVKSREGQFFYHHPQNRFWRVLAAVTGEAVPETIEEKRAFLLREHIAVWDVIASCEIEGSSDSSIRNAKPNDVGRILAAADIRAVYVNGGTAFRLYEKYLRPATGREAVKLPSTSPANAAFSLDRLTKEWSRVLESLKD